MADLQDDDKLLAAMGLEGLEGEDKRSALQSILYTLNIRVGRRVIEGFNDQQAAEFERLSRPGSDPEKLIYWMAATVPNYHRIIEEEATKLRDENRSFVDEMMAKSRESKQEAA
jgi:hypothetical protein